MHRTETTVVAARASLLGSASPAASPDAAAPSAGAEAPSSGWPLRSIPRHFPSSNQLAATSAAVIPETANANQMSTGVQLPKTRRSTGTMPYQAT